MTDVPMAGFEESIAVDATADVDPALVEIVRNQLHDVAEEMQASVMNSAYSPLWQEAGDLSCAALTPAAEIVGQSERVIPVHIATMTSSVREAVERTGGFDALEPGATGEEVHDAVCDVYEDAGHPTLRSDPTTETGYIHSTGHGVGLDVHEGPAVSTGATDELKPGHIVTIEPGLYDPEIGGVRLEDIVVVTEDGYENFTDYPLDFEL